MKILFLYPPQLDFHNTSCYHYTEFGETVDFFLQMNKYEIDAIDASVMNYTWSELFEYLCKEYDLICVFNNSENINHIRILADVTKKVSPKTKIITWGHISVFIPTYFKKIGLDAAVYRGDWELGIYSYINYLEGIIKKNELKGIYLFENNLSIETPSAGYLDSKDWGFPALEKLPIKDYEKAFGTKELAVSFEKGCPYHCEFCRATLYYGANIRNRPVKPLLDFVEKYHKDFDAVYFAGPVGTLKRENTLELCQEIIKREMDFEWRCVTTFKAIDEELLKYMGKSGCKSIAFGVETLEPQIAATMNKTTNEKDVREKMSMCIENGITPKAYIMLGMPNQTKAGVYNTIYKLNSWGAKIRPAACSPHQILTPDMDEQTIMSFNKRTYNPGSVKDMDAGEFIRIIMRRDPEFKRIIKTFKT